MSRRRIRRVIEVGVIPTVASVTLKHNLQYLYILYFLPGLYSESCTTCFVLFNSYSSYIVLLHVL